MAARTRAQEPQRRTRTPRGIIHKALGDAVKRGKAGVNVADLVEARRSSRTRPDVWTAEQLRTFLTDVADDRFYAAWLLWSTTGMRRGEVAGLSREDLDLDADTRGSRGRSAWSTPKRRGNRDPRATPASA